MVVGAVTLLLFLGGPGGGTTGGIAGGAAPTEDGPSFEGPRGAAVPIVTPPSSPDGPLSLAPGLVYSQNHPFGNTHACTTPNFGPSTLKLDVSIFIANVSRSVPLFFSAR